MPQLVVTAVLVEGRSKSDVARDVSRRWVITLVQRFLAEGDVGLQPRSRRPQRSPTRTATSLEDEIVAIRKDLDGHGHEAGAATIAAHLTRRHGAGPAVSTIWRIRTARGFVTPQPHKRPKSSFVRFEAAQPNERWQTGITCGPLADGTDAEICNWIDDPSRCCLASTAAAVLTAPAIDALYRATAAEHGDPAGVLTDNGAVFTGRYRGGGPVALEVTLHARGVVFRLPALPPADLRQGRTLPPDPEEVAGRPTTGRHDHAAPGPARRLPRLLQHRPPTARWAAAPRPRPTPPARRPRPPASRSSTATSASATTRSTATAS
jgi:hypothetical protein